MTKKRKWWRTTKAPLYLSSVAAFATIGASIVLMVRHEPIHPLALIFANFTILLQLTALVTINRTIALLEKRVKLEMEISDLRDIAARQLASEFEARFGRDPSGDDRNLS